MDRLHRLPSGGSLEQIQGFFLGLHRATISIAVPARIALGDEVRDTGRLGSRQQVIVPFGPQPNGLGEPSVHVFEIRLAEWADEIAVI